MGYCVPLPFYNKVVVGIEHVQPEKETSDIDIVGWVAPKVVKEALTIEWAASHQRKSCCITEE